MTSEADYRRDLSQVEAEVNSGAKTPERAKAIFASLRRMLEGDQDPSLTPLRKAELIEEISDKIAAMGGAQKDPALQSDLERRLRAMPQLYNVLTEAETTGGLESTRALVFREIISDRTKQLIKESPPATWSAAEKSAFERLVVGVIEPLFEYGVLQSKCIDARVVAVRDPNIILDSLNIGSGGSTAWQFNEALNTNELVKSVGVDDEQFAPDMGVVQMICCAMYKLMKTYKKDADLTASDGDIFDNITTDSDGNPIAPTRGRFRSFHRGNQYAPDQAQALVDHICRLDSFQITDELGNVRTLNIKQEMDKFPPQVQKIIRYIALLKASRDDLGQKASNYIQLYAGKSPKLEHSGANDKQWDSGYISRTVYKASQTANNEEHKIVLSYIDLRRIDGLNWDGSGNPSASDFRAQEIFSKQKIMDAYLNFYRPSWDKVIRPALQCIPTRWNDDFPALDEFCNLDHKSGRTPATYKDARDAWVAIKDASYQTLTMEIPAGSNEMRQKIEKYLSDLFTKCAIMIGYLGTGLPDGSASDKYLRFHQIPRSALKMALFNLIVAVPGEMLESFENYTGFKRLFGGYNNNDEVVGRRRYAVDIIREQIIKYPSLGDPAMAGTYANELLNFLDLPQLTVDEYISPQRKKRRYNAARIAFSDLKNRSQKERDRYMSESVAPPFIAKRDESKD